MNTKYNQEQRPKAIVEFMLSEYKTIAENRMLEIERGQNYVNLFLTITSGAAALLALMSQIAAGTFRSTSIVILLSLLLLGIISFIRVIQRDIRITSYARRLSRIRRYFVEIKPNIVPYLPTRNMMINLTNIRALKRLDCEA
jgi:hypothetical protein